jgi:GAF domain-containing protein
MKWELSPGASLAELATIELRRITDVLQVDHASLFLRDADDPERARAVAETGLSAREALPGYCTLLTRAIRTAKVERFDGPGAACDALASPLVHDDRALGALLVVTRRANRRLGAIDSEVVREATQTLVERFLAPADRGEPRFVSERAARPQRTRR